MNPAIEAALIAQLPWLGAPVVKQITDVIEKVVEDKAAALLETGVDFAIIDGQTSQENTALGKAQADLEAAIKSGDQARIDAAQKEYDDAQSALTNDDGSGVIQ